MTAKTFFAIGTPYRLFGFLAPMTSTLSPAKHSAAFSAYNRWSCQWVVPFSNHSPFRPASSERVKGCSTSFQINIHGERSNGKSTTGGKVKPLFFERGPFFRIKRHHVDERIGTAKDVTRATRICRVGSVVVLSGGLYHVVSQDCRGVVSGLIEVEHLVNFRPNLAAVFISKVKGTGGVESDQINRPRLYGLFKFLRDKVLSLDVVNGHLHVLGDDPEFIGCRPSCLEKHLNSGVNVVLGVFQAEVHHPHFSFRAHESGLSFCLREIPDSVPLAQVPGEVQKKPGFTSEFGFAEDEAGVLPC